MNLLASAVGSTLIVAVGGAAGTVCRFWLGQLLTLNAGLSVYGTGAVNLLGSFFFGLLWSITDGVAMGGLLRLLLLSGFAGAFTTFSTLMFETVRLLQQERWIFALLNLLLQTNLGLLLIFGGLRLGRSVVSAQ